jgi:hypothetical protein
MAKGKRTNNTYFCPDCDIIIGNSTYNKANAKVGEINYKKHCKKCHKHVTPVSKDTKKGN